MALALGDFGYVNVIPDKRVYRDVLSTMTGLISYMASEVVAQQKMHRAHSRPLVSWYFYVPHPLRRTQAHV
jgi:hypothetical protein